MKKNINILYAFLISMIIMLITMAIIGFYPFGNKTLLMLDGIKQYPGFLGNLIDNIELNKGLTYSFKGLLGFNLYAVIVYYLFNITNIFAFLFGKANILYFYTFIIILKIGLSSLTMCIYLNNVSKNKKTNLLFSICYGLMVYNTLYFINFMWFDSIILFPLVILGIEKIFKNNNYLFYTILLALSIMSNFYIGYMICIFSVIYFIYRYILDKKKDKTIIFKYILYSLLAGLICAIILIPVIIELLNGKGLLISNYSKNYWIFDYDFINVFYKLTIGSFINGDLEYGTPNVYVSILVFVNFIMFFFNNKIKKKEKILTGTITVFFLLSMSLNFLDYFWQMMQMPIWYPVRYAFIFDFFLIIIAVKNFNTIQKMPLLKNIIIIVIILALVIIGFFTSRNLIDYLNVKTKIIYLGISIIFIIYYFIFIGNENIKKYCIIILVIELGLNTYLSLLNTGNPNTISEFNNNYQISNKIISNINDKDFYRLTIYKKTTKNNGALLNYNDINYFSSIRNQKVVNMLQKYFGFSVTDGCNLTYYYNNPLYNALFNIKYYISSNPIDYYQLIKKDGNNYLYQNNDATSLGFITNKSVLKLNYNYPIINNINNFVKTINNDDKNIAEEIKLKDTNVSCSVNTCIINGNPPYIKYEYKSKTKGFLVIDNDQLVLNDLHKYSIKVNNKLISTNNNTPIILNKNDKVEILIIPDENNANPKSFKVYYLNYDIYKTFIKNINNNKLKIVDYKKDNYLKGTINVNNDSLLFTTISNDKGWNVYVDGKKTKIVPILKGLIGINLSKGKHTIEFKYSVPGFKLGAFISLSAIIILLIITYIKKRR